MFISLRISTLLLVGLGFCIIILFYISLPPVYRTRSLSKRNFYHTDDTNGKNHNLAILVPFRDRFEELLEFAPFIHKFLNNQQIRHHIFVINQVDNYRFNRASLLNVGFLETSTSFDYIALHDVDLLPLNPKLHYLFLSQGPYHISSPYLHPRYHYPTFIGGILLLKREHFRDVNGMSNNYWGWGLEDDEFYARLKEYNLKIFRPENFTTGIKSTFKHIHSHKLRRRDMIKCYNQQLITRKRDRRTGLSTTRYNIVSQNDLTIDGAPLTVFNVELECNYSLMPWCNCTHSVGNTREKSASNADVIVPKLNRKIDLTQDG